MVCLPLPLPASLEPIDGDAGHTFPAPPTGGRGLRAPLPWNPGRLVTPRPARGVDVTVGDAGGRVRRGQAAGSLGTLPFGMLAEPRGAASLLRALRLAAEPSARPAQAPGVEGQGLQMDPVPRPRLDPALRPPRAEPSGPRTSRPLPSAPALNPDPSILTLRRRNTVTRGWCTARCPGGFLGGGEPGRAGR